MKKNLIFMFLVFSSPCTYSMDNFPGLYGEDNAPNAETYGPQQQGYRAYRQSQPAPNIFVVGGQQQSQGERSPTKTILKNPVEGPVAIGDAAIEGFLQGIGVSIGQVTVQGLANWWNANGEEQILKRKEQSLEHLATMQMLTNRLWKMANGNDELERTAQQQTYELGNLLLTHITALKDNPSSHNTNLIPQLTEQVLAFSHHADGRGEQAKRLSKKITHDYARLLVDQTKTLNTDTKKTNEPPLCGSTCKAVIATAAASVSAGIYLSR